MTVPTTTPTTLVRPDAAQIAEIATDLGYAATAARAGELVDLVDGVLGAYDAVAAAPTDPAERGPIPHWPAEDDPSNAWYRRTELRTSPSGPLAGRRIAVKDNILVAGLPMAAGSRLLDGCEPSFDATAVARVLDAGAVVVGKTTCEYLCLDGTSCTSDFGVVHHPRRPGFSAGGSSSGNAVALAEGSADLALGTDQAGSIRVPASFCGVVGLKPTHGLVPYTGALGLDPVIDHLGPMATSVADAALLLEVIAGDDGQDPRQRSVPAPGSVDCSRDLDRGVRGLRVGVLTEGFGQAGSEPGVDAAVRGVGARLAGRGAEVVDVSVPQHAVGLAYWTPLVMHGMAHGVVSGQGFGVGREERYPIEVMDRFLAAGTRVADTPSTVTSCAIVAEWVRRQHGAGFYARAVNAVRGLRTAYDAVLGHVDVLLMPTTPHVARPLPAPDAPLGEYVGEANDMFGNTAAFNATHHPALSLPCGEVDGLPVGAMLVGRRFDEAMLLRVGQAAETA